MYIYICVCTYDSVGSEGSVSQREREGDGRARKKGRRVREGEGGRRQGEEEGKNGWGHFKLLG